MKQPKLTTRQGQALTGTPWLAYPRPQMRRSSYCNLNGSWDFTVTTEEDLPQHYDRRILVPFCPESDLSGIGQHFEEGAYLCYRRQLVLPEGFQQDRVLLHIGAADQIAEIYVNQKKLYTHIGGYEAFTVDITDALQRENELIIRVTDDLRSHILPYGKQVMRRGGMWYTPVSGIWQTVWLESVSKDYVNHIEISSTLSTATIRITPGYNGTITLEDGSVFPLTNGVATVAPADPQPWTPESPRLYAFTLQTAQDTVESYFALRTLETKTIRGIPRLCLNGKPYFFHGLLDQGYWPDGLFTPPSPECYAEDILAMKTLGFNTLRKHIKVEPEQFYYDCDRLGMIVFQDMVNNGDYNFLRDTALPTARVQRLPDKRLHRDPATREAFLAGMAATVLQLRNHPSICYWTIFNEGWGQFDSDRVYPILKALDASRFIDSTSGWFRRSQTDVDSRHIYFGPWKLKASNKPLVLSEFGGYAYAEPDHVFCDKVYGYRACPSRDILQKDLLKLYETRILPAIKKGLCAAIYTQVSDIEDEINGLLTYDRKVTKVDAEPMQRLALRLQQAMEQC